MGESRAQGDLYISIKVSLTSGQLLLFRVQLYLKSQVLQGFSLPQAPNPARFLPAVPDKMLACCSCFLSSHLSGRFAQKALVRDAFEIEICPDSIIPDDMSSDSC